MSDTNRALTPLGDLLQHIAPRLAVDAQSPLVALGELTLPAAAPQATPLSAEAAVAWRALIGETGLAWQAEALTTVRRGGGIGLVAPPPLGPATLLLLIADQLHEGSTFLLLAPDRATLNDLAVTVRSLDALMGGGLPHLVVESTTRPPHQPPALLLMTPETLHQRVLRLHDRRWSALWAQLNGIVLPALDQAAGAVLGHIRWLLRRVARLRPLARPPVLYTSIAPIADPEETLALMVDALPPMVRVTTSRAPLMWAMWRGGTNPLQMALDLAVALRNSGITVHVGGRSALERAIVERKAADLGITIASQATTPAHTLIVPGSFDAAFLPTVAASGYRAVIIVGDTNPSTLAVLEQSALATPSTAVALPMAASNSYVDRLHLRCAAEERPLTADEIAHWGSETLVQHLQKKGILADLPGPSLEWQPVATSASEPDGYTALNPISAGGDVVRVEDQTGQLLDYVDAAFAERCLFPGAGILGGVVERWADDSTVVANLNATRRTRPERRTTVTVREQFAERPLDGGRADVMLRAGRVLVREQIVARRELQDDGSLRRVPFDPPLELQWSAPAVWIAAPDAAPELGETLAGLLPLLVRCTSNDIVPCVHDEMLYLVEAQPGGRGLIDHLYTQFEALLHVMGLARKALRHDRLARPAIQAETAWLEAILMPLAVPEAPPTVSPLEAPERRPRTSMIASPQEVAARRQMLGRSRPRPTQRQRTTPIETPPPPASPSTTKPSPTIGMPSDSAAATLPIQPRPLRRDEAPAPRTVKAGRSRVQDTKRPQRQTSAPVAEPTPTSERSTVLPIRREPPPFERPPYQERASQRSETAPKQPTEAQRDPVNQPSLPDVPPFLRREANPAPQGAKPVSPERPTGRESVKQGIPPTTNTPSQRREEPKRDVPPPPVVPKEAQPRPNAAQPKPTETQPQRPVRRELQNPPTRKEPPPSGQPQAKRATSDGRQDPERPTATGDSTTNQQRPLRRSEPQRTIHREELQRPLRRTDPPVRETPAQPPAPQQRTNQPPAPHRTNQPRETPAPQRTNQPPAPSQRPTPQQRTNQPPASQRTNQPRETPAPQRTNQPARGTPTSPQRAEPPLEPSNPAAMAEKMRRMREQREAELQRKAPVNQAPASRIMSSDEPEESRFKPGNRVFCVPYGEGTVKKARIRDGRELLLVEFPELGDVKVDPAVNAVRLLVSESTSDEESL